MASLMIWSYAILLVYILAGFWYHYICDIVPESYLVSFDSKASKLLLMQAG